MRTQHNSYTQDTFVAKASSIHNNKYDYTNTIFTGVVNTIEVVCPIHGAFNQRASDHLCGCGCKQCGRVAAQEKTSSSTEEFIAKAVGIHGDKYTYNNVNYVSAMKKVSITCPHHGDFLQKPNVHLDGSGCRHCRTENIGWSDTKWEVQGAQSRYFIGYRLYVTKFWNSDESFIKIGKTFVSFANRYKDLIPYYNYKVLKVIEADAKTVCQLERKYQRINKDNKCVPTIKFSGYTECFTSINIEGDTYES